MLEKRRRARPWIVAALAVLMAGTAGIFSLNNEAGNGHTPHPPNVTFLGLETEPRYKEMTEEQIRAVMDTAYKEYEKNMAEALRSIDPDAVLLLGHNITKTAGEFMEYKYTTLAIRLFNETLFQQMVADTPLEPTYHPTISEHYDNKELLLQYLRPYILAEHARAVGLEISREELDDYIARVRQIMYKTPDNAFGPPATVQLEFICRLHGWQKDEYWNMPQVRERYEQELLRQKLEQHWRETGKVKTDDDVAKYEQSLLDKAFMQIDVNWALLYKIP